MTISILSAMTPLKLQPIPYQGSKRALAPRICSLIKTEPRTLVEPFAGSAAVSLYAAQHGLAKRFVLGDSFSELIELWRVIIEFPKDIAARYRYVWLQQSGTPGHFNAVRDRFNADRDPADLLYLIARCVKNAIRFNRHGRFTQSADNRRMGMHPDRFEQTALRASALLKDRVELITGDFTQATAAAGSADLVYMDPPYQGTTYGRDKRYASGLERPRLIDELEALSRRGVPYLLSYDGQLGDRVYGEPLPDSIGATQLLLHAGRSSQATLAGQATETIESLYVSHNRSFLDRPSKPHPASVDNRQPHPLAIRFLLGVASAWRCVHRPPAKPRGR